MGFSNVGDIGDFNRSSIDGKMKEECLYFNWNDLVERYYLMVRKKARRIFVVRFLSR